MLSFCQRSNDRSSEAAAACGQGGGIHGRVLCVNLARVYLELSWANVEADLNISENTEKRLSG